MCVFVCVCNIRTNISQKLRRMVLPVGVVDSGVFDPVVGVELGAGMSVIGEGPLLRL